MDATKMKNAKHKYLEKQFNIRELNQSMISIF